MPAGAAVRLRPGDTLWALARHHHTTVAALQVLNHLGTSTLIHADASLRVPVRGESAPVSVPEPTRYRQPAPASPGHAGPAGDSGSPRLAAQAVFGSQYECAAAIISRESRWDPTATNTSTGAYGLPQALPGSKMATAGADWATNPLTQLRWMHAYITTRYGDACNAWAFWQAHSWY